MSKETSTTARDTQTGAESALSKDYAPGDPHPLIDACPSWCESPHTIGDDRIHFGPSARVLLTLAEASSRAIEEEPWHVYSLHVLDVYLEQAYREVGPSVCMSLDEGRETPLTLDEAEKLAEALLARVTAARS